MSEWIRATRTAAGYYADDPPAERHYQPTCRERQDAALDELFSAVTRLASDLYALRKRVAALEAAPTGVSYAILEPVRDDALDDDPRTATANQTYTWLPGDAWSLYCAAMDGNNDPDPMEDI